MLLFLNDIIDSFAVFSGIIVIEYYFYQTTHYEFYKNHIQPQTMGDSTYLHLIRSSLKCRNNVGFKKFTGFNHYIFVQFCVKIYTVNNETFLGKKHKITPLSMTHSQLTLTCICMYQGESSFKRTFSFSSKVIW